MMARSPRARPMTLPTPAKTGLSRGKKNSLLEILSPQEPTENLMRGSHTVGPSLMTRITDPAVEKSGFISFSYSTNNIAISYKLL